jgi:hypothetical protein
MIIVSSCYLGLRPKALYGVTTTVTLSLAMGTPAALIVAVLVHVPAATVCTAKVRKLLAPGARVPRLKLVPLWLKQVPLITSVSVTLFIAVAPSFRYTK